MKKSACSQKITAGKKKKKFTMKLEWRVTHIVLIQR